MEFISLSNNDKIDFLSKKLQKHYDMTKLNEECGTSYWGDVRLETSEFEWLVEIAKENLNNKICGENKKEFKISVYDYDNDLDEIYVVDTEEEKDKILEKHFYNNDEANYCYVEKIQTEENQFKKIIK